MKKQSILLIDDSADMLVLQKAILEADGFEVFTAGSGAAAFDVLNKIASPNLIILDLQMDDMSGVDFLNVLEVKKPAILEHVPVVFLSGTEVPPPSKAVGHIRKFPDIEEYLTAVHQFIETGVNRSVEVGSRVDVGDLRPNDLENR